ncbi:Leucine-rich repeat-containing protein 4C [Homalodisca vitripennis]|nr:Leucine-rich repeat-containing protein 4C [Homalodisca vitripennis]
MDKYQQAKKLRHFRLSNRNLYKQSPKSQQEYKYSRSRGVCCEDLKINSTKVSPNTIRLEVIALSKATRTSPPVLNLWLQVYRNGEEAKEVIQRMSKHKFHKLDLRNNRITEFPTNTFGPVAFTVKELRLDGNPLLSNCHDEGNMLQRGGLFHLTELRELNLSRCGLKDIDFFTPWNSNHLEVVDLSDNGLSAVPSNLQFFHKLKKLHMDGNPITEVGELPFALLWNLQVLTMSNCRISSIDSDPFRNMDRLKLLNLQSNNLTRIGELRLSRSCSTAKMYVSGNPWHCACDMLMFVERYNYAVRDLEQIRCASPRWLEGLRAAYLTKEILSLDSIDGSCLPTRVHPEVAPAVRQYAPIRAERLEVFAVVVFALAAVFMLVHISCSKRREKLRSEEHREDINYIRIDKKPNFK